MSKRRPKRAPARRRHPITASMYKALRRDIDRLLAGQERIAAECTANRKQCEVLQRDIDHVRQLIRGV